MSQTHLILSDVDATGHDQKAKAKRQEVRDEGRWTPFLSSSLCDRTLSRVPTLRFRADAAALFFSPFDELARGRCEADTRTMNFDARSPLL